VLPSMQSADYDIEEKVKGQDMKKKGKGKQLVGFEGNKIEEE